MVFSAVRPKRLAITHGIKMVGFTVHPEAKKEGRIEPPPGHPVRRTMELFDASHQALTLQEQRKIIREIQDIMADERWSIGISTIFPKLAIVKEGFQKRTA